MTKKSLILLTGLSFSILSYSISSYAQSSAQVLKLDQLKKLAANIESHGLKQNWYINDQFNRQLDAALMNSNPATIDILISNVTEQIAKDLNRGRVIPNGMSDKVKVSAKEFSPIYRQYVQLYLNQQMPLQQLIQQVSPKNIYYQKSLHAYQQLLKIHEDATWVPVPLNTILTTLKIGTKNPKLISFLRHRLASLGYNNYTSSTQFDFELTELVYRFQEDHGLVADGIIGNMGWRYINRDINQLLTQAMMNLDRSRWLPDTMPSEYIFVNLATQRFNMFQNNQVVLDFKTINGRTERQTPILFDSARNIVLNPTWTVPFSIFVKDKLPEIQKDPGYVYRLNMKVVDDISRQEVSAYSIDWLTQNPDQLRYTLVQSPGPWNALGFIKFPLQNPYAIYLHDTDSRRLFDESNRLFSSGCVRLQQPFELAEKLLENPKWTVDTLRAASEYSATQATKESWLKTKRAVPVYLFYITMMPQSDGRLIIKDDQYGLDSLGFEVLTGRKVN